MGPSLTLRQRQHKKHSYNLCVCICIYIYIYIYIYNYIFRYQADRQKILNWMVAITRLLFGKPPKDWDSFWQMQCFTNWFRFHQARSFLFSCAPYKELNWATGHLDVAKITRSILPVLPATAFLFMNTSLHTTAAWTTPLPLPPNSYNRLTQERRATASCYYGLICTFKCHS